MYLKTTFDDEFYELMMYLKSKYPKKLFDLDGIGKQTDISEFSKEFFSNKTSTSDVSVDDNSNVDDTSVVAYTTELPKALFKYNSYFVLWKKLKQLYSLEKANSIIEKQIKGDIYINDLHGIGGGLPYSYHYGTIITIKYKGDIQTISMEKLFDMFEPSKVVLVDRETIDLTNIDIQVLDEDNTFVNLTCVLRHIDTVGLLKIETKGNRSTIVTKDHPVILQDGSEKRADKLSLSDNIKISYNSYIFGNTTPTSSINLEKVLYSPNTYTKSVVLDAIQNSLTSIETDMYSMINGCFDYTNMQIILEILEGLNIQFKISENGNDKFYIFVKMNITGIVDDTKYEPSVVTNITEYTDYANKFVYDITTETGHFHSQGMIQHNCFNYSTLEVAMQGLPMVKKIKSKPPKNVLSFKSQLEQFITIASNSSLGASGIADFLVTLSVYVDKIRKTKKDSNFSLNTDEDIWNYVKENVTSFIYTINQPMRGNQCVTEDTEVLTPNGFKKYNELNVNDDIYTWDDGSLNIQKVQKVNVYDYDGEMHRYGAQVVTPNHRVLHKDDNGKFILSYSKDLIDKKGGIIFPVVHQRNETPDYNISDEEILKYAKSGELLPNFFTEMSKRQIRLFLESDGLNTKNIDNDTLQHLEFLAGYCTKYSNNGYSKDYFTECNTFFKGNKISYQGKVWCPTTDDGVVVFRKDGKIFISGNSPFTNISIYDKYFIEEIKDSYKLFIDDELYEATTENIQKLQDIFLDIMNSEMERTTITFPVVTACFSVDDENNLKDYDFLDTISKANIKYGFINIYAGKTSTLSSCCRLRSDLESMGYQNSIGGSGTKIGSLGVCTINLPRLSYKTKDRTMFLDSLEELVGDAQSVNNCKRKIIQKRIDNNHAPMYKYGFMDINKQYSTVGIIGLNEALEILGYDILTEEGQKFAIEIMERISSTNKKLDKKYDSVHNVEQIPGESTAVKLANKDKLLKYNNGEYDFYSNQFIPLITEANLLDRIKLQGMFDKHFDGGSISHINIDNQLEDPKVMSELIITAIKQGVVYFAINYVLNACSNGHITIGKDAEICNVCGNKITDKYTRVVGFLTNVKDWNQTRREKDFVNRKFSKL